MDNKGDSEPWKNADDSDTKTEEPVVLFVTEVDVVADVNVNTSGGCASPSAPLLEDDRDAMVPSAPVLEALPYQETSYVLMSVTPRPSIFSGAPMATRAQRSDDILLGGWEVGYFSCFKHCVPNGWMMVCCPCILMAQVTHRLGIASYGVAFGYFGVLHALQVALAGFVITVNSTEDGSESGSGSGARSPSTNVEADVHFVDNFAEALTLVAWILYVFGKWYVRAELRRRLDIPGWCIGDCCAVCCSELTFCPDCAAAQMATQLKTYRPGHWDFGPSDVLPPFEWER